MRFHGSSRVPILAPPVLALALLVAPAGQAQPGGGYRRACIDDSERFCPDAGGGRREIAACLQEHQGELSEACRTSLAERQGRREARMEEVRGACGADVEAHCPDTEPGRERGRCLRDHASELSEACRETLAKHRGGLRPGGRRRP